MGQYYKVVNLDKRQVLHPHAFGDGMKLMEFVGGGNTIKALGILLAVGNGRGGGDIHSDNPLVGSWAGDRIAIVGDYADDGEASTVRNDGEDISAKMVELLRDADEF